MNGSDWTFGGTWPYQPRWFDTPDGRLHYVDEGPRDAPPVVLMHGNPTWGYLYRNFIPPLVEAGYRVIVPDLPPTDGASRSSSRLRSGCSGIGAPAHCGAAARPRPAFPAVQVRHRAP